MIYIYPEKNLRAYPGVERGSAEWEETYKTVSYTHLDVYKRQVVNLAANTAKETQSASDRVKASADRAHKEKEKMNDLLKEMEHITEAVLQHIEGVVDIGHKSKRLFVSELGQIQVF